MTIMDVVRRLLDRAEVDAMDRGTRKLQAYRKQERDDAEQIAALHRNAVEVGAADLTAAIERRNAVR